MEPWCSWDFRAVNLLLQIREAWLSFFSTLREEGLLTFYLLFHKFLTMTGNAGRSHGFKHRLYTVDSHVSLSIPELTPDPWTCISNCQVNFSTWKSHFRFNTTQTDLMIFSPNLHSQSFLSQFMVNLPFELLMSKPQRYSDSSYCK